MVALTTVAKLKTYTRLDGTFTPDHETLYQGIIDSVSAAIQSYLGYDLEEKTYVKNYDGDNSRLLDLGVKFVNVTELKINDQVVDPSYYSVKKESGFIRMIKSHRYNILIGGYSFIFPEGVENIQVTFTAGFAEVPADIEHACKMMCSYYLNKRGREEKITENDSVNNTSITTTMKIPVDIRSLLARYKRLGVSII